jgi:sulfide:quinone oxidoreductase
MSRLLAERKEGGARAPAAPASAGAKPLEVQLPRDPSFELRALAKSLACEPRELAAELLAAALADAKSYLSEAAVDALELSRRELLVEDLPEHQPGVEFHGGGT